MGATKMENKSPVARVKTRWNSNRDSYFRYRQNEDNNFDEGVDQQQRININ